MPKATIDSRLLAAQEAIDNALSDAEIQGFLSQYGYNVARIGEGKAFFQTAPQLHQKQKAEYGDQFAATQALEQAWEQANAEYMRLVKLARIAFKSDLAAITKLGLDGQRKETISGWLTQAKQFYTNAIADPAALASLGQYGLTAERLQAGQALMQQVETANAAQQKEKGEAQQATLDRDAAFDKLDEWLGDFIAVARIALEAKPQFLEKLGVLKLNQPRTGTQAEVPEETGVPA